MRMSRLRRWRADGRRYPTPFYNEEEIEMVIGPGAKEPFFEFPVMRNGKLFEKNRAPGADRVIYSKLPCGKFELCSGTTHEGCTRNRVKGPGNREKGRGGRLRVGRRPFDQFRIRL